MNNGIEIKKRTIINTIDNIPKAKQKKSTVNAKQKKQNKTKQQQQ
jgi:hypothetical protein